jgi:tripartite-type tricarboxylate transporter receptor subunit TctC
MWHSRLKRLAIVIGAFGTLIAAMLHPAQGQGYPTAPVRFIVPVPAGGVTDAMARIVGQRLQEMWGQPVIVENRPGGNYSVAAQAVARAPADGYTLLVAPDSTFTANPFLFENLAYSTQEFTPIVVLCRATPMLVVNQSLGVNSVEELIALAKAKPGTLNYGSYGIGTYAHLSMEDFKRRANVDIVHIPYRGAAPAATGLLAGEISMLLLNLSSIEPHEAGGKVKILASAGEQRVSKRLNLPTISEAGLPGFSTSIWFALFGPANMPADVVKKIHADVTKALEMPQTREFFEKNSFERVGLSPGEFSKLIERDSKHWESLIKTVGVKRQ